MKRWIIFIVTALIGLWMDLASKSWAFTHPDMSYNPDGRPQKFLQVIDGWFDFALAMNKGAAFSMFWGQSTFFMIISVVAFLALIYFVHTSEPGRWFGPFIIGLVFAGVAGNFWDRCVHDGVRDFISVHTPDDGFLFLSARHDYPTFNVADIWIFAGAITMAIAAWRNGPDEKKDGEPEAPEGAPEAA